MAPGSLKIFEHLWASIQEALLSPTPHSLHQGMEERRGHEVENEEKE